MGSVLSRRSSTSTGPQLEKGIERQLPPCVGNLKDALVVSAESTQETAPRIGTHDGSFHCDELLACAMLKMLPAYEHAVIVRTRDEGVLDQCSLRVDVGGKYDHSERCYDHHQRGFDQVMHELNSETRLSSAGLVYRHYGKGLIRLLAHGLDEGAVDAIYHKAYKGFLEEVDGIDNGVEAFQGGTRNYEVTSTLSGRVRRMNLQWNEAMDSAAVNARFASALEQVGTEFVSVVCGYVQTWWPARAVVLQSILSATVSGILTFDGGGVPFAEHLYELENEMEMKDHELAKYVLYPAVKGKWRIEAVPIAQGSFTSRKKLPESWRGLRDDELSEKTGIGGCMFAHKEGFMGGASTKEGVFAMARAALIEDMHTE